MVPVHTVAAEVAKIHSISVDKIISKLTEVSKLLFLPLMSPTQKLMYNYFPPYPQEWLLSTNSTSTDMNITQVGYDNIIVIFM